MRLGALVAIPTLLAFSAIIIVPATAQPIGRALRGEAALPSGVLAVFSLVAAAALCARTRFGERTRLSWVAAGGATLFAIVMIIVTFSASEAASLGVPSSMGGLSTSIAPIAPLALALDFLTRARASWVDPYARRETMRYVALTSAMIFLALVLCPMGPVRTSSGAW